MVLVLLELGVIKSLVVFSLLILCGCCQGYDNDPQVTLEAYRICMAETAVYSIPSEKTYACSVFALRVARKLIKSK